nr:immunoglobulin light chain junction region [Macaca mulatta]
CLQGYSTPYSV